MKSKIKITGKAVKKILLWLILAGLGVTLIVVAGKSFKNNKRSANNSVLEDLKYSGEYRNYLAKELITKEDKSGKSYDDIIKAKEEEKISAIKQREEDEQNQAEQDYQDKVAAANAEKEKRIQDKEDECNRKIEELENSDKPEEEIEDLKIGYKNNLENEKKIIEKKNETKLADLKKEIEETRVKITEKANADRADLREDTILEELIADIVGDSTLFDYIARPENTPQGYGYSLNPAENKAIRATYNQDKTDLANTVDSVHRDVQSGLKFKIANKQMDEGNTTYVYSGKSGSVVYDVDIPVAGYYNILLDYIPFSKSDEMEIDNSAITEKSGGAPIERTLIVDGNEELFKDLTNISFMRSWHDGGEKFIDATGNEIKPLQVENPQRIKQYVRDSVGYVAEPYLLYFKKGLHTLEFKAVRENMGIADVYVASKEKYINYAEYHETHIDKPVISDKTAYIMQAEGGDSEYCEKGKKKDIFPVTVTRSSATIYGTSDRTSPYNIVMQDGKRVKASPVKIVLNTIGGLKWSTPGDWITWKAEIKTPGLYQISLRAKQNISRGLFSARKLSIDGVVPFAEAMNCKFVYGSDWSIVTLGDKENGNYYFYLDEGEHTFTLECTLGDYAAQIARVQDIIGKLNALYRKIVQRTGIKPDPYMDYFENASGKKLIENAKETFNEAIYVLKDVSHEITKISGEKSSETASLETMGVQLKQFVKNYRKIQKSLNDFSTNIASLGTWILNVSQQSLSIDYIMIHSDDYKLPKANPDLFTKFWFDLRGFVGSFFFDYESVGLTKENKDWETVDVWLCTSLNQGREQANAISSLISEASADPSSILHGINVKLKVVAPNVLLTATLAGRGPDVAINVGNGTPVNYALRGATKDLTIFTKENIDEYFKGSNVNFEKIHAFQDIALSDTLEGDGGLCRFHKSAMMPYKHLDGYYALPYTQSFLMTFYRTDMFKENGWEVPKTWDDVILLIPELLLMNFQFYLPLNTVGASSVVNQIFASHLYQNIEDPTHAFYREPENEYGETYVESNFDSNEANEAFEFWCNFYTEYKFPLAASFVNRFRSGETPIGIVDYSIYNTLAVSAPEIRGKWDFAPLPGTKKEDGSIDHTGSAGGTALIMMGKAKHPYEAWAFMDWFTSADTQASYAREIEAILGAAARHNTANVDAFSRLAWTEKEKESLLDQWDHTIGVPEVAGGYYMGRYLENAFREVVNKNLNPRQVLPEYIVTINKEINRKREEFGLASADKRATGKRG